MKNTTPFVTTYCPQCGNAANVELRYDDAFLEAGEYALDRKDEYEYETACQVYECTACCHEFATTERVQNAVSTPANSNREVVSRMMNRYYTEGLSQHLMGRIKMMLDALTEEQIGDVFEIDIETQLDLEKQ